LGFVIVVTLVLLRLPERTTSRLKPAIGSVFVPLFGLAGSGQRLAEKAGRALVPRQSLATENERLRRDNAELQIRLQQAESFARENERLRGYLGCQSVQVQGRSGHRPRPGQLVAQCAY
jgi:cell shape-determining protein MreC